MSATPCKSGGRQCRSGDFSWPVISPRRLECFVRPRFMERLHRFRNQLHPIVFVFPGQGSQYVNMGRNFYDDEPLFRSLVDRCANILEPDLGRDLREVIYPAPENMDDSQELLKQTQFTQPALFVIEYALARLWEQWGVVAETMLGHSVGEFVAATLAGVFNLEDALHLVALRAKMMQAQLPGAMLSVRKPAEEISVYLSSDLDIAAINAPSLCVVSGTIDAVEELCAKLSQDDIASSWLHTSHAFHSKMMDAIVEPFGEEVRKVKLTPPQRPFLSTVTAHPITVEEATDPMYWARHLRHTVRFADTVREAWKVSSRVLLEVGPRNIATTLAKQTALDTKSMVAIASLDASSEDGKEWRAVLQAAGKLWLQGIGLDWLKVQGQGRRRRVPLPTYPFERKRYWVDPIQQAAFIPRQVYDQTIPILPREVQDRDGLGSTENIEEKTLRDNAMTDYSNVVPMPLSRHERIVAAIKKFFEDATGIDITDVDDGVTFVELGLDSLALTQCAQLLTKGLGIEIRFRQLIETLPSVAALAAYAEPLVLEEKILLPSPKAENVPMQMITSAQPANPFVSTAAAWVSTPMPDTGFVPESIVEQVVAQQLRLMARQLELIGAKASTLQDAVLGFSSPLNSNPGSSKKTAEKEALAQQVDTFSSKASMSPVSLDSTESKKIFGPGARIETLNVTLPHEQQKAFHTFICRYNAKTQKSKSFAAENRHRLADPRVVTGFKPRWKEIVYPIVVDRSQDSRLWDIDGNEYVDLTCGFGADFLGHRPPFIVEAIKAQLERGFEIGPQHPLVADVARLLCEITGHDRAVFCNTGSEAVLGATRIGPYRHRPGSDRHLRRGLSWNFRRGHRTRNQKPAIDSGRTRYTCIGGTTEPGSRLRRSKRLGDHPADHANEIAAVLVEPIQSRRPEFQPKDFLRNCRTCTEKLDIALIFDEIITGFRLATGGAQEYFGVRADIATYGKILGGGLPIGAIAGCRRFMDALDGGELELSATIPSPKLA